MRRAIQALVIVLILATCGGLILPAVLRVRESAARIQCVNNLRSLGLSVSNYKDSNDGRYPLAAMPNADLSAEKHLSWLVEIMPYVESNDIYSRMDKKAASDAEQNQFAALLPMKVFHCPGYPEAGSYNTSPASHYLGIAGVGENAASLPANDPHIGFFGYERTLHKKDLVRGESETAMVAETGAAEGAWTAAGPATVRGFDRATSHFGGNHRNVCQVLFADASVRPLDAKLSDLEWGRLAVVATDAPPD